jgi:hypothetical protein
MNLNQFQFTFTSQHCYDFPKTRSLAGLEPGVNLLKLFCVQRLSIKLLNLLKHFFSPKLLPVELKF